MNKNIIAALMLLGLSFTYAEETTKKSEPSFLEKMKQKLDKPGKSEEKTTPEKKETAPKKSRATNELSDSDKALKAHGEKEAAKLSASQQSALLQRLNSGTDAELEAIPGVGEKRAKNIKKARPLADVPSLIMVDDIGEVTYDGIIKWAKDGMPTTTEKKETKTTKKPSDEPKEKAASDKKANKKDLAEKTDKKSAEESSNPLKRLFGKKDQEEPKTPADSKSKTKDEPKSKSVAKPKTDTKAEAKSETPATETTDSTSSAKPKRTPKPKTTTEKKAE